LAVVPGAAAPPSCRRPSHPFAIVAPAATDRSKFPGTGEDLEASRGRGRKPLRPTPDRTGCCGHIAAYSAVRFPASRRTASLPDRL